MSINIPQGAPAGSVNAPSLKSSLNNANPNSLADQFRYMGLGTEIRALPVRLRNTAPFATAAAYPYVVQTGINCLALPDDAKCTYAPQIAGGAGIMSAYARSGTGTPAQLVVDISGSTAPAAGHCKVGPTGDILFAAADVWTSVDIVYLPEKQAIVEFTLPVASSILTLPTTINGVTAYYVSLLEAQALVGTTIPAAGNVVLTPGAAPTVSLSANFNTAKTQVLFVVADAVTSARVKLGIAHPTDLNALLENTLPNAPGLVGQANASQIFFI